MPCYEYECECGAVFEELLDSDEAKQYKEYYVCPSCGGRANRVKVSTFAFNFAGNSRGPGQNGSHDIDYPVLDKAVGRSSNTKWTKYLERKEKLDKVRKETGSTAISSSGDTIAPVDSRSLANREKALKLFNKAKNK